MAISEKPRRWARRNSSWLLWSFWILDVAVLGCQGSVYLPADSEPHGHEEPPPTDESDSFADDNGESIDGGLADGGLPDSGGPDEENAIFPTRYPTDQTYSPISPYVIGRLMELYQKNNSLSENVFAKVGDSITVSPAFLDCFDGSSGQTVDWNGSTELLSTWQHFLAGNASGTSPFLRDSLAAKGGMAASWAITGDPSPLTQELAAIFPKFALVMYGTNDIGYFDDETYTTVWYFRSLDTLIQRSMDNGTIPILFSIPPRDDNANMDLRVPHFNEVIRGIAQGYQVPFIDYHRELMRLADHGLSGDGVHPNQSPTGACIFTDDGLSHGYNVRNWLSIETLHRIRTMAVLGDQPPDSPGSPLLGDGTPDHPFEIDSLPFTNVRDTKNSSVSNISTYPSCAHPEWSGTEAGPEIYYHLRMDASARLRLMVLCQEGVDLDVFLLLNQIDANACVGSEGEILVADVQIGDYYVVVDSFVKTDGTNMAGKFLLVVMHE